MPLLEAIGTKDGKGLHFMWGAYSYIGTYEHCCILNSYCIHRVLSLYDGLLPLGSVSVENDLP